MTELLPVIFSFLGGPAGGLAGAGLQWLAGKLGAKDTTVAAIKEALNGTKPEDLLALRKLDIEFQMFCLDNGIKINLAQIEVNKEEAKNSNIFVSGWRPFIGWICGFALLYVAILEPMARFLCTMLGYTGSYPVVDTDITMQVLLGMLGLAGLRSYDKKTGTAS